MTSAQRSGLSGSQAIDSPGYANVIQIYIRPKKVRCWSLGWVYVQVNPERLSDGSRANILDGNSDFGRVADRWFSGYHLWLTEHHQIGAGIARQRAIDN